MLTIILRLLTLFYKNMESFNRSENLAPAEKRSSPENREEKIREAEIVVKEMFNRYAETSSVVRRVQERPYFDDLSNREN